MTTCHFNDCALRYMRINDTPISSLCQKCKRHSVNIGCVLEGGKTFCPVHYGEECDKKGWNDWLSRCINVRLQNMGLTYNEIHEMDPVKLEEYIKNVPRSHFHNDLFIQTKNRYLKQANEINRVLAREQKENQKREWVRGRAVILDLSMDDPEDDMDWTTNSPNAGEEDDVSLDLDGSSSSDEDDEDPSSDDDLKSMEYNDMHTHADHDLIEDDLIEDEIVLDEEDISSNEDEDIAELAVEEKKDRSRSVLVQPTGKVLPASIGSFLAHPYRDTPKKKNIVIDLTDDLEALPIPSDDTKCCTPLNDEDEGMRWIKVNGFIYNIH
jgi:hypothetical protein